MSEGTLLVDLGNVDSVRDALRRAEQLGRESGRLRIPRLDWDDFFMLHAHLAATRSTCDRGPELLLDPGRHGVGAVIVKDHRIIAGGYNGSPPGEPHCSELTCTDCERDWSRGLPEGVDERGMARSDLQAKKCPECGGVLRGGHVMVEGHCVRTLHAEENALLQCALDGTSPVGGTVYTSAGPCWECAKRFLRVKVARVVFAEEYQSRHELSGEALKVLRRNGVQVERLDVREALGWSKS